MARYRIVERSQNLPIRLVVIDEFNHRFTFDTWNGRFHDPTHGAYLEFCSDYGVWYPVADQRWYSAAELCHWQAA
jgi:hypothetical protein